MLDSRACIDPQAKIAATVSVGPYAIIGPQVEIDEGTWVGPHAFIKGPARIGKNNRIYQFASIGEDPQDMKYQGETTYLEIGDGNTFREFCTINRGTVQDQGITRIGNHNLFMSYVHIAHDCCIGDHTIFANNSSLAGHVQVDDYAILSAFCGVHQFCRIGKHSFLSGGALVVQDVLPFIKVAGIYAKPFGLNLEGLKRRGFDAHTRMGLKAAYKIIYRQKLTVLEAVDQLKTLVGGCPEIEDFIDFLENSVRGIVR